jgi:hypothetical protein
MDRFIRVVTRAMIIIALMAVLLVQPASASDDKPQDRKAHQAKDAEFSVLSEDDIESLPANMHWDAFCEKFGPPVPCCISIGLYLRSDAGESLSRDSNDIFDYYWVIPEGTMTSKGVKLDSILIFTWAVDSEAETQGQGNIQLVCVYPLRFKGQRMAEMLNMAEK